MKYTVLLVALLCVGYALAENFEICKYCAGTCDAGQVECGTFALNECVIYHDPCLDVDYGYMKANKTGDVVAVSNYADGSCTTQVLSFSATCDTCITAYGTYVPCSDASAILASLFMPVMIVASLLF